MRRKPLSTAIILAGLMASGAIQANDGPIEEVVVKGKYLYNDQANAVKTLTPILDVPQSLSIMTDVQIREQSFQNMGDVLRYTPGLSISQGEGHRDAIIIRGIQTTADFFIDGLRDDVQYYRPLYNVEQLEVLRGANALLFGRGGGGGVINRVQKKAKFSESFTSINASANTFSAHNTSFDTNYVINDRAAVRLNAYYQNLENHRDFYEGDSWAVNPTFTFKISENTSAEISYERVDDDRVVDRGVPSQDVVGGPDVPLEDFDETFFGSADTNRTTLEADILRARFEHDFNDQFSGNLTIQRADYDKFYQNLYASEEVSVVNGTFAQVELDGYRDTTERENFIVQANLVGEFETGSIGHTVLFGFEFGNQETTNARADNVFAANGDDQLFINFNDPLVIPAFAFTPVVRDRDSDLDFSSVYLQDQIDLTDQFKLLLGLRYDSFDIDVFDRIEANDGDAVGGDFSRKDSEVTPRYGFIYKPMENVSIYASHSETFLPRSGDQFLTLNLDSQSTRPQFFDNDEIGVKWDIRGNLALTFSAFNLERESYTSVDPEDASQVIVIEGSETKGWEVQLQGNLTPEWEIVASYADLDGEVDRADGTGNDGNKTRQTPDSMYSVWTTYQINDQWKLGLGANYQDSFFVREDNSVEVPDYFRVDAGVYFQPSEALSLQVNIENLFNEEYYPDAHSNDNISTGAPLNARFSVNYRF